jgi:hypothetical protein
MAEGDQDHGSVALAVPVVTGDRYQLVDFVRG